MLVWQTLNSRKSYSIFIFMAYLEPAHWLSGKNIFLTWK